MRRNKALVEVVGTDQALMTPKRQGAERRIASTPFSFDGDCEIRAGAALLSETPKATTELGCHRRPVSSK